MTPSVIQLTRLEFCVQSLYCGLLQNMKACVPLRLTVRSASYHRRKMQVQVTREISQAQAEPHIMSDVYHMCLAERPHAVLAHLTLKPACVPVPRCAGGGGFDLGCLPMGSGYRNRCRNYMLHLSLSSKERFSERQRFLGDSLITGWWYLQLLCCRV